MFHQPLHFLYDPSPHTISLETYELVISYVDRHDENTVEFSHEHPKEYEIYYVLQGGIDNFVTNTSYHLEAGDFLFLAPGIRHGTLYKPEQPKEYLTFVFSFHKKTTASDKTENEAMETFFNAFDKNKFIVGKDHFNCRRYVDAMMNECSSKQWGWDIQLPFLYTNFIFTLIRNFVQPAQASAISSTTTLPIEFTKYLHANYQNKELSLQHVADHFFMTPRHVNRLFQEYFKSSLSKTLTRYRISYAKNYIINTTYSVDTIAEQVGFSSASTLSRLFKENEGMTISEYRFLCKQTNTSSKRDSTTKISD